MRVERLAGSVVLIDSASGHAHHLNETAAVVWYGCDGSTSVDVLAARLTSTFDTDDETARLDVLTLIDQFKALGLLAPSPAD